MDSITGRHPIKRLLSGPYWWLREQLLRVRVGFGDLAKAFVLLVVLRPAADFFPTHWAFSLARFFGEINAFSPFYGRESLGLIKRTFSVTPREAMRLTSDLLSLHLRDFLVFRMVLTGREKVHEWPVVELNRELIDELRQSQSSYIIANGHFSRHAFLPLYLARTVPQRIVSIVNPPIPKSISPRKVWLRAHYGQMLAFLKFIRPEMELLYPGQPELIKKLVKNLSEPGNAVIISVDAPWDRSRAGSLTRPFAGRTSKCFATGTARLARLAQCPIVMCLPYLGSDGRIILEWTRLIQPPDPRDSAADVKITNLLLDDVEIAIGKRPSQYVMGFLGERNWDHETQSWK